MTRWAPNFGYLVKPAREANGLEDASSPTLRSIHKIKAFRTASACEHFDNLQQWGKSKC